jgi:hypothetical protein
MGIVFSDAMEVIRLLLPVASEVCQRRPLRSDMEREPGAFCRSPAACDNNSVDVG